MAILFKCRILYVSIGVTKIPIVSVSNRMFIRKRVIAKEVVDVIVQIKF